MAKVIEVQVDPDAEIVDVRGLEWPDREYLVRTWFDNRTRSVDKWVPAWQCQLGGRPEQGKSAPLLDLFEVEA